jgi:hypothetical protein
MKLQMELRKSYYPEPRRAVVDISPDEDARQSVLGAVTSFHQEQGYRPTHVTAALSREEAVQILNSSALAAASADLPPWKTIGELLRLYLGVNEIQLVGAPADPSTSE